MPGIPVVLSENGLGLPVKQVESGAAVMTVADNGFGIPIVLGDVGQPFVVEGAGPSIIFTPVLSSVPEGTSAGTLLGSLSVANPEAGTYTFTEDTDASGKFANDGTDGKDVRTAGTWANSSGTQTYSVTYKADNGAGSVVTKTLTFPVLAVLGNLALDSYSWTPGTPASGSITGAHDANEVITLGSGWPSGLTINSAARTWAYDGTGTDSTGTGSLIGTHPQATNSPHTTSGLGWTLSTVAPATSTFTMAQLGAANRVYQRATDTGGGQGTGQGTIPVTISSASAGTINARCRSAADGTTILQSEWAAATIANSATTANIAGVDARLGWFYLDLKDSSGSWKLGTVAVGMGALFWLGGQSLAQLMVTASGTQASVTIASAGVTISPYAAIFAIGMTPSDTYARPSWGLSAEGSTGYNSAGNAEWMRLKVAQYGVNCGVVGYARGSTDIAAYLSGGSEYTDMHDILSHIDGFEEAVLYIGHSDASQDTASATFKTRLSSYFTDLGSSNGVKSSSFRKIVGSIPNYTTGPTLVQTQAIRLAMSEWASANSAALVNCNDLDLYDGTHPAQSSIGIVVLARHFHRAGVANGDTGPRLTSARRAAGSPNVILTVAQANGTALSGVGSYKSRFLVANAGGVTPLTISSASISGNEITLVLASTPADGQPLDVYVYTAPDLDAGNGAGIYDNSTDSDGIAIGRQLINSYRPVYAAAQLTEVSTTYASAATGFGQASSAGHLKSAGPVWADVIPNTGIWTVEMRINASASVSNSRIIFGNSNIVLAVDISGGRLIAQYKDNTNTDNGVNGTYSAPGSTNPVVAGAGWKHIALVSNGTNVKLFVDGVLIGTNTTPALAAQASDVTFLGNFTDFNGFDYLGLLDEVVVWDYAKYTATFTPPTTPYVGNEGMRALYHLDNDGNAG